MELARAEPRKDGSEKQMFECPKCAFIETRMATDPFKSEEIKRLTENVRPPV
jgi:hypothetical protein